jgi:hypothetical protein
MSVSRPGGLELPLPGHESVDDSARRVRRYRYAVERAMRIMAGWIALTPELSAKLVLGRQVWDAAQHADLWGKRLPELRAPAQTSEPASAGFVAFMDALESRDAPPETVERLVGLYRVLKPHLLAAYSQHLGRANPVYEPPTRRILLRCVEDERRHIAAGETVLAPLLAAPGTGERAGAWQARLEALLAASGGVTGDGLPPAVPLPASGPEAELSDDARELVRLEQQGRDWDVPEALRAALGDLGAALAAGDAAGIRRALLPGCAWDDAYAARLAEAGLTSHRVVAFAKLGHQRLVKLRLEGPAGAVALLARMAAADGAWRVAVLELARFELARPA